MKTLVRFLSISTFLLSTTLVLAQDFSAFEYRTIGPSRGGRVTTVTGTPVLPGTFYLGASGAGVWKTDDYGTSWNNISDGFFDTPSIGAIEVALNDPNIVYVGTGSDGLRSNIISGKGVYKSIDAGKTWDHIGLAKAGQIGAVEIDPTNNNIVWVAAIGDAFKANEERGIYKTIDGGATWEKMLHISNTTGFADLELLPGNPNVVYAAAWKAQRTPWTILSGGENKEGGIYKSVNGGKDWIKLETGLPKGLIGKIDLAVSAVDSSLLYAVIEAPGDEGGVYKSVNQGKTFVQTSSNKGLVNRPFYYTNIELDPTNPDIVYSNANPLLKSTDGGENWTMMAVPHGDNHDIWINPNNTDLLIQCNDGGANVSHNGGKTWSSQFNQPTAEIYQVAVDDQYPYWIYGAQQDNTTIAIPSSAPSGTSAQGTQVMIEVGGCETGPSIPKPGNHNIVYNNCKGRFSVYNKITGTGREYSIGASNIYGHNPKDLKYRFQRVAPVHVSPHDPDVVYMGSQFVHKTRNDGVIWETISPDLTAFEADKQVISGSPITRDITGEEYYSTIYSIRESKIKKDLIWTGSNDGVVSITQNGGQTWSNVTPKKMPKGGRVESIEPSQFNPAKAYISVDRHLLGDATPYFYKTEDYGKTWELLSTASNGIPSDYTAKVLREDPETAGLLYAGTEYGMFVSLDDGKVWKTFQQNLPVTPITDVIIHRGDLILSTMGRGFWILDNITSLRNSEITNLKDAPILFKPDTTIRYRTGRASGDFPNYPATGVLIDYYLPNDLTNDVKLEILDANKKSIVTIVSDSTQLKSTSEKIEDMGLSMTFTYLDAKLETKKGLNRFTWDLKQKGAWSDKKSRSFKNGPMVPPGIYTARLIVGKQNLEQSFEILVDPRLEKEGITNSTFIEQLEFQNKVINLLSEAIKFQVTLEGELKKSTNSEKKALLDTILKKLKNAEGAYPQQMLIAQISYLSYIIGDADKEIGKDAKERYSELVSEFNLLKNESAF
ncbi:WD40/YVTN/BNR-like repeat-containing protein [Maribacter spongiicola]|uniref:WD40/YVTN/BNR-like repeat-containing protein n=1 Tax=Maribacter spongiicola TaxID=1206753 RepID=UPI003F9A92D8